MLMDVDKWSVHAMLDKYGRNQAWQVMRANLDLKDKSLQAEIMIGADKSEVRHASYEDICKEFSWKSFEVTPNGQTIIPVPDPEGFYNRTSSVKRVDHDADGNVILKRKRRGRKAAAED